ncbi:hypothetical protein BMS3Abin05_01973 [bacterium BMS3Abin05]|nr:hypothetical protein BMS3Abin05_01973 [bacterium BMS3Abin05]GBE27388.1 hypothetical protein BMS3Bbin03_01313 [bacterium BMS3Bbin03]
MKLQKFHSKFFLFVAAILFPAILLAAGTVKKSLHKSKGRQDQKIGYHDANKIFTIFYNWGGIGDWTGGRRIESGVYPRGSGHSYFAEFTPVLGAEVTDANGVVRHIFSDGLPDFGHADVSPEGKRWQFEPVAGYANPNQDRVAMSDDSISWPSHWPDKDHSWDGHWDGQYGKYARADQESYYRMDDYPNDEFQFYPDPSDSSKRGLGLEVEVRGYQWVQVAAEDILIWTYWITNKGKTAYKKMIFGMYGDADVGDDGDQRDDDSWFDKKHDIVYQWDHDDKGAWGGPTAYFGWKFLESPGNPYDGIDNDEDGMIDESQWDGIDNDGDWNPLTDDVGSDGIGPNDPGYTGPDPDGTEGNGQPDLGEPNFEYTDNDESDQIGLTSFAAATWPNIDLKDDEKVWQQTVPGSFEVPKQTTDITFLYGSGYFPLDVEQRRKFAVAMLFGDDLDDILRNAVTMQNIYNADYNFAKPPLKPHVTVVPGDHKVTLYWDKIAEQSRDPIYGYDFEGYTIYRSTDPAFLQTWVITDAYGNKTFNKPIAQFDKIDGLTGPHPIGYNGLQFNMGTDSGLRYSWTDTTVENGQTYYYAVCSYDQGYDKDFYARGISKIENLQPIIPSESSKRILVNAVGVVTGTDVNTVVVTPEAPAAGYVPPENIKTDNNLMVHNLGFATGRVTANIIDPSQLHDGWEYEINFDDSTLVLPENTRKSYSVLNKHVFTESFVGDTNWVNLRHQHLKAGSVSVTDESGMVAFSEQTDYEVNYDVGNIRILSPSGNMQKGNTYQIKYLYYPLFHSTYLNGEIFNSFFNGLQIVVKDDPLKLDHQNSGWIEGDCNYKYQIGIFKGAKNYPLDYEVRFKGTEGTPIREDARKNGITSPFEVWNVVDNSEVRFVIMDKDRNKLWSSGDDVIFLLGESGMKTTYQVTFTIPDSMKIDSTFDRLQSTSIDTMINGRDTTIVVVDSVFTYDTTRVVIHPPKDGDVFLLHTMKPFTANDVYSFTTTAPHINKKKASDELDRIAVVPNPYVVTVSWEPQNFYKSGRGERKIDFIHLPRKSTIKIFTMRGYLVKTLVHDSPIFDGSESWDLTTKDGLDVSYGIYIYKVDAGSLGEKIGKFAIIK